MFCLDSVIMTLFKGQDRGKAGRRAAAPYQAHEPIEVARDELGLNLGHGLPHRITSMNQSRWH